ncbi:MAG TPA: cache domain-containing protein, partial [Burkholderiaceae bacterium]
MIYASGTVYFMEADERRASASRASPSWWAYAVGPLLIIVLVSLLAGTAIWTEHMRYRERALASTQNMARLLENQLVNTLDKVDIYLQLVGLEYREGLAFEASAGPVLEQGVPRIDLHSVTVADASGAVRVRIGKPRQQLGPVSQEEFFQRALAEPDAAMIISGPLRVPEGNAPFMVFARAARDAQDKVIGVVYANMSVPNFDNLFAGIELGPNGVAVLRTDDQRLVYRHPVNAQSREQIGSTRISSGLREALQQQRLEGLYQSISMQDQRERIAVYRKLHNYPFYVIVAQDMQDVMEGWRVNAMLFVSLAGITIALTLLAWYAPYRWSRQQIQAMHNRFEAIVQTSSDSIVSKTVRGIVTTWNRGAEQIFGYAPGEMLGR